MIVREFLFEAVILTLIGALAGILAGEVISFAGVAVLGLTPVFQIDKMIEILFFSVGVGAIFGIYPAFKAYLKVTLKIFRIFLQL